MDKWAAVGTGAELPGVRERLNERTMREQLDEIWCEWYELGFDLAKRNAVTDDVAQCMSCTV